MPPPPKGNGKGNGNGQDNKPPKPKKHFKTYEFKVYGRPNTYGGEPVLLTTIFKEFSEVKDEHGRVISNARVTAEEYVRNIGIFGITIEDPAGVFTYYPPPEIFRIEFTEIEKE